MLKAPFRILFWLLLSFGPTTWLRAEVVFEPSPVWRQARLVSPGQQVWSFESSLQSYDSRFNELGAPQPLGQPYGRAVTWGQLVQAELSMEGRAEIREYMRRSSLRDSDVAATAKYQVQRQEVAMNVRWAYGLTKRWMIGFQLPLVLRRTAIAQTVEMQPALSQVQSSLPHTQLVNGNMGVKVRELARAELSNSGYDEIPSQAQRWDWGDISLIGQFIMAEGPRWTWALQETLRLPTARNASLADYIQTNSDEGQFDVAVSSLVDFRHRRWVFSQKVGYVSQMSDQIRLRSPSSDGHGLGATHSVRRDLGDYFWGSLQCEFKVNSRLALNTEYSFLSKETDRYGDLSQLGHGYDQLGEGSNQEVHLTRLGLSYRLGERSARSGVENKWLLAVAYNMPLAGRNSIEASRASLEMTKYF